MQARRVDRYMGSQLSRCANKHISRQIERQINTQAEIGREKRDGQTAKETGRPADRQKYRHANI